MSFFAVIEGAPAGTTTRRARSSGPASAKASLPAATAVAASPEDDAFAGEGGAGDSEAHGALVARLLAPRSGSCGRAMARASCRASIDRSYSPPSLQCGR